MDAPSDMPPELPPELPIDQVLAEGARVMWVAAHPDDEFLSGALLARATQHHGVPVRVVLLTRGGGGAGQAEDGGAALSAERTREMEAVAERFGFELALADYWNAPLPMSSFPKRPDLWARWREQGDPVAWIAEQVREFRPDVLLTFEPTHGATGHPEHQLASRATIAAARLAAEGPEGWRVPRTYYLLKRHWLFRLFRDADPGPVTQVFDGHLPCDAAGTRSLDFLAEATRLHATQAKDMGAFRRFRRLFRRLGLRRVDPFSEDVPVDA